MTVQELYDELKKQIDIGNAEKRVIARCDFIFNDEKVIDYPVLNLDNVYYQSGDIELYFYNDEIFTSKK